MLCLIESRGLRGPQHEHRDRATILPSDYMAFTLTSSAFEDGETIPRACTCDGIDVAPPLAWSGAPEGTRSYALIMEDPDAPRGIFTHWLLYDIPATTTDLQEQADGTALPNSFGRAAYGGPCPPPGHGPHRYVFTLYAIDVPALDVRSRSRASFDRALRAHTLGTARLTGRYERKKTANVNAASA
jgi:Raf kinase inhibitor-like YbhB/YbcL family protein